ncbi:MAG: phage portal protein [Pseudobutyrivibrio sp.]|nr:phage portal protein [Pseudobutyrivibrio sp.]
MPEVKKRFQNAWNAFMGRDPTTNYHNEYSYGYGTGYRPDRPKFSISNEKSIVNAIYNRISLDVAAVNIEHVRVDENGRYEEKIKSGLEECLTVEANIDQTGRSFIQDVVISMFDEGSVAIVPTDTSYDPMNTSSYDILSLRTGQITEWFPDRIRVSIYNETTGRRQQIILPKNMVAIVENPFYTVMNEPNSTLQRLIRTLNRIDRLDEQNSSGKLDLIIQLPYSLKTDLRRNQAEERRRQITDQLAGSKYGIAYIDQAEKIVQLNRPIENTMWAQATDLMALLYQQLGISDTILNGTADEQTMKNYYNNTIDPVISAITEAMIRTFLTKTARTQGQTIKYFRDPFKLVPVSQLADIADKFTRNEIASSNELRAEIGWKPSKDPRADELRNKNLNEAKQESEPVNLKKEVEEDKKSNKEE